MLKTPKKKAHRNSTAKPRGKNKRVGGGTHNDLCTCTGADMAAALAAYLFQLGGLETGESGMIVVNGAGEFSVVPIPTESRYWKSPGVWSAL